MNSCVKLFTYYISCVSAQVDNITVIDLEQSCAGAGEGLAGEVGHIGEIGLGLIGKEKRM